MSQRLSHLVQATLHRLAPHVTFRQAPERMPPAIEVISAETLEVTIPWDRVGVLELADLDTDGWSFTKRYGQDEIPVSWNLALTATAAGVHVVGRLADAARAGV